MLTKTEKKENRNLLKRILHDLSIVIVSIGVLYFALVAYAGSLAPSGSVGITMMSLEDIYNVLVGTNPVTATPKEDGNVLEILKCITTKINDGTCI